MNTTESVEKVFIIAGLTPSFLEKCELAHHFSEAKRRRDKPVLWFKKNEKYIRRMARISPWWQRNVLIITQGQNIKPSELLRSLSDMGYERSFEALRKGEFKQSGSIISIYAINHKLPLSIEFLGNAIETIEERALLPHFPEEKIFLKTRLGNIKSGDYVVHIDHGIGIFRDVVKENSVEYFSIEYAAARQGARPDILLLPKNQQKKISPYIGFRIPQIHRLGTPLWKETKKKAADDILKFAKELLEIYKNRFIQKRPAYEPDSMEKEVWDSFPYEETPGQHKAIKEIFEDLEKPEPMERLLVGDVGFGKTEVALRAALRAALNGKQAAILAPTTVLADQHLKVFQERLEKLPIKIERLSRLESSEKTKKILKNLKEGTLDIVTSTHRILSKDIAFKNLGLLIIDEEQRFGVKQKEELKKRHPNVDILLLSATPIPRTLSFSLSNLRATSLLDDPPYGRMAPKTFVLPWSRKIIHDSIEKEIKSGGQVYYLSNRIKNIPKILELLDGIFPKIKKGVLHGRLSEKEIIKTMDEFRKGKIKILISTTIIENGLDISSANTLIVENASRLGLAEAHQLRGRIGRGAKESFAYFLYSPLSLPVKIKTNRRGRITEKGEKRLEILLESQYLGAGFDIAKRDLEIRGAGNILGREQSGVMNRLGWNLYYELLSKTLSELKEAQFFERHHQDNLKSDDVFPAQKK